MARNPRERLEIESFNLTEMDVSGLDMRLELTTIVPQSPICNTYSNCPSNCGTHCGCYGNFCGERL